MTATYVQINGHKVPVIASIHQKVYAAASAPGALSMDRWHTCKTTHCRAGWVVALAGAAGRKLELETTTPTAARMIYRVSDPTTTDWMRFYCNDDEALEDMRCFAEQEAKRQQATA